MSKAEGAYANCGSVEERLQFGGAGTRDQGRGYLRASRESRPPAGSPKSFIGQHVLVADLTAGC